MYEIFLDNTVFWDFDPIPDHFCVIKSMKITVVFGNSIAEGKNQIFLENLNGYFGCVCG